MKSSHKRERIKSLIKDKKGSRRSISNNRININSSAMAVKKRGLLKYGKDANISRINKSAK